MKKLFLYLFIVLTIINCTTRPVSKTEENKITQNLSKMETKINKNVPTIGILIFEGVIMNEVVAPLDVFSNSTPEGRQLFNVVTIAKEDKIYKSAHGLKIMPDFTISKVPELKVLVVPSSYNPSTQTSDKELVEFVQKQNKTTDYIASHCAGAFLIGESGIAENRQIVTYVTGGKPLKASYPNLKVADDSKISVLEDGKFISSNGSLVSYIASLDLLEKLTSKEQRKFVEKSILLDRLREN